MVNGKERLSIQTMKKKVQIDYELFLSIAKYFAIQDENYKKELEEIIVKEVNEKLDKLVLHDLYTKSKQAPTNEEREQARQEYLNKKGIHEDFRY